MLGTDEVIAPVSTKYLKGLNNEGGKQIKIEYEDTTVECLQKICNIVRFH